MEMLNILCLNRFSKLCLLYKEFYVQKLEISFTSLTEMLLSV